MISKVYNLLIWFGVSLGLRIEYDVLPQKFCLALGSCVHYYSMASLNVYKALARNWISSCVSWLTVSVVVSAICRLFNRSCSLVTSNLWFSFIEMHSFTCTIPWYEDQLQPFRRHIVLCLSLEWLTNSLLSQVLRIIVNSGLSSCLILSLIFLRVCWSFSDACCCVTLLNAWSSYIC